MPTRISRKRWPRALVFAVLMLLVVMGWQLEDRYLQPTGWQRPSGQLKNGDYSVARVIDGDTIVLEFNRLRVRLQGIDTPETVDERKPVEPWGPEATDYTQRFLAAADWQVRLEIDGEPVDRYGRHLAFVWHHGRLLNEELVLQGLAHAKTNFDFSEERKARLRQAQQQAQANELGIWSNLAPETKPK